MRKPRLEIEGGLYHIISRGNYRQRIFSSRDDYLTFLLLLERQKAKLPFYLYAYCLMPNHFHLLIERRDDSISRVMQRLLTAYSQYYHRKHQKSGHLLQGRYKAILCQTDRYLAELVRYIHLNPVRAKMARYPEDFEHSSHRAYLGLDPESLVDAEPVLRHFGASKKMARERFTFFVRAAMKVGHQKEFYRVEEGRILGSEDFVTDTKKRVGEIPRGARPQTVKRQSQVDPNALIKALTDLTHLKRDDICSANKTRSIVLAKEAMIVIGRSLGVSNAELARLIGLESSVVSRRYESARSKMATSIELRHLVKQLQAELESRYKLQFACLTPLSAQG
jgi:REP element-mobilizing transposase RayT